MSTTLPVTMLRPPSVEAIIKRRRPLRNVHKEVLETIRPLDRLAVWIIVGVGSMGVFLGVFEWAACWLGWNVLAPRAWQFDPPMAFVFWLFISNVIQILLKSMQSRGELVRLGIGFGIARPSSEDSAFPKPHPCLTGSPRLCMLSCMCRTPAAGTARMKAPSSVTIIGDGSEVLGGSVGRRPRR